MDKKELAIQKHDLGYNCCQAVVCSFAEELGIPEEILYRIGEGFGLGMGNKNCTCGAVSGAIMLAGLKNSGGDLSKSGSTKAATYKLSAAITEAFKAQNGSVICSELKGIESGAPLRSCPDCICDAIEIAQRILG